ncbi:Hsp33 family molecular chaperone HslO [Clostridium oryzae]|uniref:33 kDa chaperonin n=1 Tax=Clostridium oryzae TaxID=1450648 RepID=A0A1V4IGD2_9CLOT|nr:Hsp33 family molecular chaperone HslO [Clostridium oryzae]OPJ59051.1 33 kDa chaperonin [Clostridium oryzae]
MTDKIITGTALNGNVRFLAAETTKLVNRASELHNCSATAAAALGRMLTSALIMGAMLKNDTDVLTVQINGKGPSGTVLATAYPDGRVKGYIVNPSVDLPANSKGKLDVGGAIGKDGTLTVIKDMGLREPYVGQIPIVSGEIGDDLAYYFTKSEQTPSAVGVGVLVNKDLTIKAAGGFIIQMLPGADDLAADLLNYRIEEMPSITEMLSSGKNINQIIEYIFEDMDMHLNSERKACFSCDCSREKVEKALISLGRETLNEIYEDGKSEELKCHFCNKSYEFTHEEIGSLLAKI